jgi:Flp pilus assembly CpaF family ATPase
VLRGRGKIFVARGGVAELTPTSLTSDDVRDLVKRMLESSGRRVDLSSPFGNGGWIETVANDES